MQPQILADDLTEVQRKSFEEDVEEYATRIRDPELQNQYIEFMKKTERSKNGVASTSAWAAYCGDYTDVDMLNELSEAGYAEVLPLRWSFPFSGVPYRLTEKGRRFLGSQQ